MSQQSQEQPLDSKWNRTLISIIRNNFLTPNWPLWKKGFCLHLLVLNKYHTIFRAKHAFTPDNMPCFHFLRHQPGRRAETSPIKNGEAFCRRHVQVRALNTLPTMSLVIAFLLLGRFGEPKYYTISKILCTAMTNCSTYLFPQFIH